MNDVDIELDLLVEAIYRKYHYDFRSYARASLARRVEQALSTFHLPTVSALQDRIFRDAALFTRLLDFLTIQVSELFRDPPFYRALREQVLPVLKTWPSLKIWVAGCGMGQELWSLAILLDEEGLLDRTLLYATDINPTALRAAESGVYPLDTIAGFTRNHAATGARRSLSDYYTAGYEGAIMDRRLRKQVVFSDHSLATDSVFSEVHLVTCRNVLIYFDAALQSRAVRLFADALVHGGFLGLGSKESLQFSEHASAFVEVSREDRIYRRRRE